MILLRIIKRGLDYILELNKAGTFFVEGYAALLLKRILTPFATGFVDLQSPAGVGIAGAIYDWDGNVYVADEGRMLARFKNYYFKLGNVNENTYQEIFNSKKLHDIIRDACTECLPMCSDCVFQPYCERILLEIIRNRVTLWASSTSDMCKKNRCNNALLSLIFLRKDDPEINKIFWSWLN